MKGISSLTLNLNNNQLKEYPKFLNSCLKKIKINLESNLI
jgi:hypothetical protein